MLAPNHVRGELSRAPTAGAIRSHADVDPRLRGDDGWWWVSNGGAGALKALPKLSPPLPPRVFSPLPVRAGRFREACRGRGQEAVSDLWSGDRHYVRQALAVMMGRGNPHGSLLRTRKYHRRAPRGCLTKSKAVAGRRPPPVQLSIDRGAVRGRVRRRGWGGIATVRTRGGMGPGHKARDDIWGCGNGRVRRRGWGGIATARTRGGMGPGHKARDDTERAARAHCWPALASSVVLR